jgi:FAD-dependent urate hydroxylase
MSSTRHALIIGSGIAGPVTAIALKRVGISSTIYEAFPEPADHRGWFLNVASNGLEVLHTLDVRLDRDLDAHPMPRMIMRNGSGRRLGEVANGSRLADGTESSTVKRGALQAMLRLTAEQQGSGLEWGKRLVAYEADGGSVTARFADGTAAEGDLLIGADGIHSKTRAILDPNAPEPSYTGLLSIGGYTRGLSLAPTPSIQHFIFGRRGFFGYLVRDSGEIWWFANIADHTAPSRDDRGTHDPNDVRLWKQRLQEVFAGDIDLINEIIYAADELGVHAIYDMPPVPVWQRTPAVLIGDAAHATSPNAGQGVAMALEDALVLARALRDLPTSREAFAAYEQERRPRVERVVAYSRQIGERKAPGQFGRFLRDLFMPAALKLFARPKALAWLYDYHIGWEQRIGRPSLSTRRD